MSWLVIIETSYLSINLFIVSSILCVYCLTNMFTLEKFDSECDKPHNQNIYL